ncbi:sugar transferase [Sporomusa sp. KB1]|uniref:sugar transferase n=1 Tax=Sporomusa sp. KB1 TaxID=943346 RepID=UPI0016477F66|nr:sugar transferase [Sporomusa sp. KB1]
MKRLFDIISSALAVLLFLPVFFIIAILIKADSKGPILFCQRRVGVNDKEFMMYKFRSMTAGTPEVATDQLSNSQAYITNVGYYLRKYSLDELPQLINILKGEMSVVGPRPALYNQYELREMRNKQGISALRPGLTGWAQINGRDEIGLGEKVAFDEQYRLRQSFYFDMKIIVYTFASVFSGSGVKVKTFSLK